MKQPIRIPEIVINYFLALIRVLKPINMSHENKGRICLPDDDNPVAEDQDCYATGWGNTQEKGFPSDILQEVKVKRVPLARCNSTLSYGGRIDKTMTCAGYPSGGRDACYYDSSGSMVCKVNSKFFIHLKQKYYWTFYQICSNLLKKIFIKSGVNECSFSEMFEKIANLKVLVFRLFCCYCLTFMFITMETTEILHA